MDSCIIIHHNNLLSSSSSHLCPRGVHVLAVAGRSTDERQTAHHHATNRPFQRAVPCINDTTAVSSSTYLAALRPRTRSIMRPKAVAGGAHAAPHSCFAKPHFAAEVADWLRHRATAAEAQRAHR